MSGGAYNYLCHAGTDELIEKTQDIEDMADSLAALGYATDAAAETQQLLADIRVFLNRIKVAQERLNPVWRAVEWWQSGDYGEDAVQTALSKYRHEPEK